MSRLVAVLAGLAVAVGIAALSLSLGPPAPLTADEWALCGQYWRDGLDSSQRSEPHGSTWFFNHMGMPDDPDTIRVCRAAAAQH